MIKIHFIFHQDVSSLTDTARSGLCRAPPDLSCPWWSSCTLRGFREKSWAPHLWDDVTLRSARSLGSSPRSLAILPTKDPCLCLLRHGVENLSCPDFALSPEEDGEQDECSVVPAPLPELPFLSCWSLGHWPISCCISGCQDVCVKPCVFGKEAQNPVV